VGDDEYVLCSGDVALVGSLNALWLDRVTTALGRKLLVLGNREWWCRLDLTKRG